MPRPLSLMSGNFDDPPASDDTFRETADRIVQGILNDNTQSPHDISPSGELYRAIDRYHRTRGVGSRPGLETNSRTMASEPDHDRRRRIQREVQDDVSPLFVLPPQSPAVPIAQRDRLAGRITGQAARRGRSRMSISDRFNERHRPTMQETAVSNSLEQARTMNGRATRQLEQARALLDDPVPNISSPVLDPEYRDITDQNRRVKRRKLESDKADDGFVAHRYGQYGQVEPGKLRMEIVSCDGGIFQEQGNYAAENVLRNDASVYCTKSPRCNLVLRHEGSTVFCLEELIIKAPHAGYTAPLQEGMVFVSMTSDDLLTRTAQYQIQYSPPRQQRRTAAQRANELPAIVSIRHHDDGTMTTAQARARRLYEIGRRDEECDVREAQLPAEFTANAQPFHVTETCSDSEADEEDPVQALRHRTSHRVQGFRYEDSDSSDEEVPEQSSLWHDDFLTGPSRASAPLRRRETSGNITLAEAAEASQIATQEAVRAVGGELMAPLAKFHIEREKTKCTLRFDPPVSARFILLKMWSPHHGPSSNIDIQYVVAKGFAGPRYFPAITLR